MRTLCKHDILFEGKHYRFGSAAVSAIYAYTEERFKRIFACDGPEGVLVLIPGELL